MKRSHNAERRLESHPPEPAGKEEAQAPAQESRNLPYTARTPTSERRLKEKCQAESIRQRSELRLAAAQHLRDQGLTQQQIGDVLGVSRVRAVQLTSPLRKRYSLSSLTMQKAAHHATKEILAGRAVGDAEKPKSSDVIRAASMVYDRVQPIKQPDLAPRSVTVNVVNYQQFVQHLPETLPQEQSRPLGTTPNRPH